MYIVYQELEYRTAYRTEPEQKTELHFLSPTTQAHEPRTPDITSPPSREAVT